MNTLQLVKGTYRLLPISVVIDSSSAIDAWLLFAVLMVADAAEALAGDWWIETLGECDAIDLGDAVATADPLTDADEAVLKKKQCHLTANPKYHERSTTPKGV